MQGIGRILREERENRNITLDMVADATKIRKKYLNAIEEETFDVLPGEVYARGFVTAYLKYLGIKDREDVSAIMARKIQSAISDEKQPESIKNVGSDSSAKGKQDEISAENENKVAESISSPRVPFNAATTEQNLRSRKSRRSKKKVSFEEVPITQKGTLILVITLVAIALLLGIKWGYSRVNATVENETDRNISNIEMQQPEDTGSAEDGANVENVNPDNTEAPAEQDNTTSTEPKQAEELQMTIRVLDITPNQNDQCWMQITVDGKASEETLSQGQERQIVAKESITLNLGNAGAVSLTVNGQDLGVQGSKGKVVKKTFNLADFNG